LGGGWAKKKWVDLVGSKEKEIDLVGSKEAG
jgi:hypothetical protein